jgi:pimeloyl-ACP methyl ester carboxylesterase
VKPQATGSERKPSLLFIHGAGCDASVWEALADRFVGKYPAYRLELPGHGGSSPEGEDRISSYSAWVRLAVSSLFATEPFVLVGHSMGGAVVMDMVVDTPPTLAGIILIGTGAKLPVTRAIFEMIKEDLESFFRAIDQFAFSVSTPSEVREPFIRAVRQCPRSVIFNDFKACDEFDIRDRLDEIRVPALILCGAEDNLTPVRYSTYLQANIASSRLMIIPESGHMVMTERPGVVSQAMESFLAELQGTQRIMSTSHLYSYKM